MNIVVLLVLFFFHFNRHRSRSCVICPHILQVSYTIFLIHSRLPHKSLTSNFKLKTHPSYINIQSNTSHRTKARAQGDALSMRHVPASSVRATGRAQTSCTACAGYLRCWRSTALTPTCFSVPRCIELSMRSSLAFWLSTCTIAAQTSSAMQRMMKTTHPDTLTTTAHNHNSQYTHPDTHLVLHGRADAAQRINGAGQVGDPRVDLVVVLAQTSQSRSRVLVQLL